MGENVSFEIDRDVVEGLAHRTRKNIVLAKSESEKGPLVELEDKVIKDKAKLTRV